MCAGGRRVVRLSNGVAVKPRRETLTRTDARRCRSTPIGNVREKYECSISSSYVTRATVPVSYDARVLRQLRSASATNNASRFRGAFGFESFEVAVAVIDVLHR